MTLETFPLEIRVHPSREAGGLAAGTHAAEVIRAAIKDRGAARIIAATGASQFAFLETLVAAQGIAWDKVEMFHLDEYVGLPETHGASFRKYLLERFIRPAGITTYHLLDGEGDAAAVCRDVGAKIASRPIDVAFVGIGENGHLAFNDPPADFDTVQPYLVVNLDENCRRQQVGEGWFKNLDEVPKQAISMSVAQILKAREIICTVPDRRKAKAVHACVTGSVNPWQPASILRCHPRVTLYLDNESASLLNDRQVAKSEKVFSYAGS